MPELNHAIPPEISTLESEIWQEFIWKRCGMYFTQNRLGFLCRRLWERMQIRHIRGYSEYYYYVAFNSDGEKEWQELLALLLNHETSFFRHKPSFAALTKYVLPRLMKEKEKHGVNIITGWSAGCSTGQEVYSMVMTIQEIIGSSSASVNGTHGQSWQIKITGSDISPTALDKARRGQYKSHELRHLSGYYRDEYMTLLGERQNEYDIYQFNDRVRTMAQFGQLNLHDPSNYWVSAQDIIFCQNVLIYLKPETRDEIVRRLCQRLNLGGYLFLAPAEVVGLKLPGVEPVRLSDVLIYQRIH